MRRYRPILPLRLWMLLALAAIIAIPVLATWGCSRAVLAWQDAADQSRLAAVRSTLVGGIGRWDEPAWQHQVGVMVASLGMDLGLLGSEGQLVYATSGVSDLRSIFPSTALTPAERIAAKKKGMRIDSVIIGDTSKFVALFHPAVDANTFREIVITDKGVSKLVEHPALAPVQAFGVLGTAFLWSTWPPPAAPPPWVAQMAGLLALLLTLAVVAWFLGQSVLGPLAAMSRATRRIADGDLNVRLPLSHAREVGEVAASLTEMSAALHAALGRQAALEEERKLFVGAIVHDLRTPLFILRGYLKGIENGVATTPEKLREYVAECRAKADALERLITDLFTYTRMEYLEQAPQREPLELGALLQRVAADVESPAVARGITLTLDPASEPCRLTGDSHLLTRAIGNLLDNAVRYTPSGGTVSLYWRRQAGHLVFTVEDTGPGIAVDDLPHLFVPLYRGEASRNRQTGGAGLGLTIARRILQAHGGDLTAANRPAGGAVFTGIVPAARAEEPRKE